MDKTKKFTKLILPILFVFVFSKVFVAQVHAATVTIYSDSADGYLRSNSGTWLTARSGGTFLIDSTKVSVGESSTAYYEREAFLSFDTSSIPAAATINSVTLSLYGSATPTNSTTVKVIAKDWGTSIDNADWIPGANLASNTMLASFSPTSSWNISGYNDFTENGTNFRSAINKGGSTRILLYTPELESSTAPSSAVNFDSHAAEDGTSTAPKLVVDYSMPVTTVASNTGSNTYNSFDLGITTTTLNSSYFGARFGTSNTGNCSTLTYDSGAAVFVGVTTWTNYHYNVTSSVSPNTSYYYCAYVYDQTTSSYSYGNILGPITTPDYPAPTINHSQISSIDDTSAIIGAGVLSYVSSPTVTIRYGTSNVACSSEPNTLTASGANRTDTANLTAFSARVTSLSPSTSYYWCIQATTSKGTSYSGVSQFTTNAALGTGCDLLPASGLASSSDKTTIAGYLGSSKFQGTLVYKASTNGWAASTFHTNANTQGETITLIRNSANGKIFGAYNPQNWTSAGAYGTGSNAFLFSLSDGFRLKQFYTTYQEYNNSAYGPTFGGGHDIGFPQSTLNSGAYTSLHSYEYPSSYGAAYTYLNGTNTTTYTPDEIEVYKLSVCTSAPPTVTTPTKSSVSFTTATLGGNVTSQGTASITERGVVVSTNANPTTSDTKFTTSGTTGVFTVNASGLSVNTAYHYRAYAINSVGTSYSSDDTFTTLNNAPTSVATNNETNLGSYYVTFNGTANPNGSQAYGYIRYFTSGAPNCTVDSGGTRVPSSSSLDYNLGSGSSPVSFSINTPSDVPLTRLTNYWYCAYARNTAAGPSNPGTAAAAGYDTFTTLDGPASGCDAPASGNLTISGPCTFPQTDYDGVDAGGSGTTNNASLILASGGQVTLLPGQVVGVGAKLFQGGSFVIGNGSASVILGGGVWIKDADNDGVIDNPVVKTISRTQPAGYIRRNYMYTLPYYNTTTYNYSSKIYNASSTGLDCDSTNVNIFQNVANLVTDADNDGYKTSAGAASQCVGTTSTINTRTYYKNATGGYTWLDAGSIVGGSGTDCDDTSAKPCTPTAGAFSSVGQTAQTVNWTPNTTNGPAATSYDVYKCGSDSTCNTNTGIPNVLEPTHSYADNSPALSCGHLYYYKIVAKNGAGSSTATSPFSNTTSSCVSQPSITAQGTTSLTAVGVTFTSDGNGNGATTSITYRYGTSNVGCSSLPSTVSGGSIGTAGWSNNQASISTLIPGATYYYCATANNSQGTTYGVGNNNAVSTFHVWTDRSTAAGTGTATIRAAGISSDGQTMIIVGDAGFIKTSTDGGASWTDRNSVSGAGAGNLNGAAIGPSGEMIVVGDSGYIRTSTTGGASWTDRNTAASAGTTALRAASIGPTGSMVVVGDSGFNKTSTSGGSSWSSTCSCATLFMLGAAAGPSSKMLAVATDEKFVSTNDGASWTGTGTNASDLYSAAIGSNGYFIAGGTGASYLQTSPDGTTWTDRASAAGLTTQNVRAVDIGASGEMYAGATSGFLKTSSDNGATWNDISSVSGIGANDVRDIEVDSSGDFIIVGSNGYVKTYK